MHANPTKLQWQNSNKRKKNASRGTTTGITERVDMHIAAYQCMITRGGTQRGKWKTLGALLIFGWMLERPCRTT